MKNYLLDTNAVIYAINNSLILPKARYFVSVITEIELLGHGGLSKDDRKNIRLLLNQFQLVELCREVKNLTIEIRQKSKIKLPDSIIMASAQKETATLVTFDKQLLNSKLINTIEITKI